MARTPRSACRPPVPPLPAGTRRLCPCTAAARVSRAWRAGKAKAPQTLQIAGGFTAVSSSRKLLTARPRAKPRTDTRPAAHRRRSATEAKPHGCRESGDSGGQPAPHGAGAPRGRADHVSVQQKGKHHHGTESVPNVTAPLSPRGSDAPCFWWPISSSHLEPIRPPNPQPKSLLNSRNKIKSSCSVLIKAINYLASQPRRSSHGTAFRNCPPPAGSIFPGPDQFPLVSKNLASSSTNDHDPARPGLSTSSI